jgi:ABC-type antimicrobial peptide transport system permease subunit
VVTRAVSLNFFDVYGLRPVAGRAFDPAVDQPELLNAVMVNVAATRALGYATPAAAVGQMLSTGSGPSARSARIIGVAPDIRHESLRDVQQPMLYYPGTATPILTVRASGDIGAIERAADQLQRQYFPDSVVPVRRASSYFAANYANDARLAKMLTLACLIAVAIATFGIYVLSAYNIRRLSKQIVLRKLFGAGRLALVQVVGREFAVLLVASAAVALPIAFLASQNYLASFVERAPIGVSPMLVAVLAAVLVTVASTVQHTLTALRLSPVEILRE